jgi:hypothetical protein
MDIDAWLMLASDDARRRGLEGLLPLLETLARSTRALRAADDAARTQPAPTHEPPPARTP